MGLVATLFGVLMVIGGGFVVTKTVSAYVDAHRPPTVADGEVRAELKPDPRAVGSAERPSMGDDSLSLIPECPATTTDGIATAIGNDMEEKPTPFEQ